MPNLISFIIKVVVKLMLLERIVMFVFQGVTMPSKKLTTSSRYFLCASLIFLFMHKKC